MHHFFEAITNNKGDALTGYYVRVTDSGGASVPLYADTSLTPIISVSGLADAAKVDEDGNVSFYVDVGTYSLNIYATDGSTLVKTISDIGMNIDIDTAATAVAAQAAAEAAATAAATSEANAESAYQSIASTSNAIAHAANRTALAVLGSSVGPVYLRESGREGTFVFDSSNLSTYVAADTAQGLYVAPASDTTGASGAWVRKFSGSVSALWFGFVEGYSGAAGTNSTTNNAAWTAMMSALSVLGKNASGNFRGLPDILFPAGCFEFSTAPDVTVGSLRIRGTGMGHIGSTVVTGATRIKTYGCGGFRFQSTNTSGISTGDGVTHVGADTSSLEDIGFEGDFVSTEAEYYGVHIRCQAHLRNVTVSNYAGDGIRLEGSTAGVLGNTNSSTLINVHAWGCRNGILLTGNNTGQSIFLGGSVNNNRRWGVKNLGSIGSMFFGMESSNNGTVSWNDGTTGKPATVVSDGTYRYFCLVGADLSSTVTITIASPGVVTWNSHGLANNSLVTLKTTGALPTGLSTGVAYYVVNATTNTFQLSLTSGGAAINTSGTQSGIHTALAGAAANAPSGTATDNAYWGYLMTAGSASGVPLWTLGMSVETGGNTMGSGSNLFSGCYGEANNQGKAQGQQSDVILGGKLALNAWSGGTSTAGITIIKGGSNGVTETLGCYQATSGTVTARLGDQNGNTTNRVLYGSEPTIAPSGYSLFFNGNDQYYSYNGSLTTTQVYRVTGPSTTFQFGTGAAVPHAFWAKEFMVPDNSTTPTGARRLLVDTAAPISGAHAQGEYMIFRGAATTGQIGWLCTTAGTPGTWTPVYSGYGIGQIGYNTGSGGAVTQGTSRTTGVTLNKLCGAITLFTTTTTAGQISTFTVTNSTVAATDTIIVSQKSGLVTGPYVAQVTAVAAGSFNVTIYTPNAVASDAPVFNFAVLKAVAA